MDPLFVNYLNISVRDAYLKEEHFSESLITELVQASLRVNYGQNTNVHEFVGKNSKQNNYFLIAQSNKFRFILPYLNNVYEYFDI